MKQTKFYFLIITLACCGLFITSCSDDDCTTLCAANEILSSDCECVSINSDPCEGITCSDGEVLTADCDCITEETESELLIDANITENTTWTSDMEVILGGRITVEAGVTLTIEPGTVIKGQAGAGANSSVLVVARGATIEACGTADAPIIFTSVADEITPAMVAAGNFGSPNLAPDVNGLWGGLILLGYAPISAQNDNDMDVAELQIEGIPATDPTGLYGGDDPTDNSGSLCYISLRHGGTNIGEGNEINGITFGGVGSGTTVNNIEIVANQDDGVEWFGGTCNATNVLVWNCGDDGFFVLNNIKVDFEAHIITLSELPFAKAESNAIQKFNFEIHEELIILQCELGKQELKFVLDSGSSLSTIDLSVYNRFFAGKKGITEQHVDLYTATDNKQTVGKAVLENIMIGEYALGHVNFMINDLSAINENLSVQVDGILNLQSLKADKIIINMPDRILFIN